jgi:hypothetical protein
MRRFEIDSSYQRMAACRFFFPSSPQKVYTCKGAQQALEAASEKLGMTHVEKPYEKVFLKLVSRS